MKMKDVFGCTTISVFYDFEFLKSPKERYSPGLLIWKVRAEVLCSLCVTWRSGFKWEYPLCCCGSLPLKNLAASLGCGRRSRAPRLPSPPLCPPPVGLIFCLIPHIGFFFRCFSLCVIFLFEFAFKSPPLGQTPGQPNDSWLSRANDFQR